MKKIVMWLFVFALFLVPTFTEARGFSGGHSFSSSHSSFSSHSTTSHSYSSSRTTTRSYSSSSHSTTTAKPKVNLTKKTTTSTTHSYSTGYRKPSAKVTYHAGSTYKSRSTRVYVNHHYVNVNHYYHAGYSPYGWFGYYHGFTTGMVMSSFWHPWGGTYYVGHQYVNYGPSPVAWATDIVGTLVIVGLIVTLCILL